MHYMQKNQGNSSLYIAYGLHVLNLYRAGPVGGVLEEYASDMTKLA